MSEINDKKVDAEQVADGSVDRREALLTGSNVLMAGGLVASYGTFVAMAGRYFYPTEGGKAWMFVRAVNSISPGESVPFQSPTGVSVLITRDADASSDTPEVEEFLALSDVCPHLGCRVHWEGHNDRFFCPCHNGVFDPDGKAIGGPPASAGQNLSRYPLKIADGSLYIEMSYRTVRPV